MNWPKSISIYNIFLFGNIFVIAVLLWIFFRDYKTLYVDQTTAGIGIALSLLNVALIKDSQKNGNALSLILQFWLLFHITTRIITLDYTEISAPLTRANYQVGDLNIFLTILSIGALCLCLGLRYKNKKNAYPECIYSPPAFSMRKKAFRLYWISCSLNIISLLGVPFVSVITTLLCDFIFNQLFIVVVLSAFILHNWTVLRRNEKREFVFVFLSYALLQTFIGSRSGFFSVVIIALLISIALGYQRVSIKFVPVGLLLIPLLVIVFLTSTYMRQTEMRNSSLQDKIGLVPTVLDNAGDIEIKMVLAPIFDRVGYLDMGAEMYVSRSLLSPYISIKNEFCALIDGITPAFDVFDRAKACRIVNAAYNYPAEIVLSRNALTQVDYQSDVLTIFGDYYLLFGVPICFIILFATGRIFRNLWLKYQHNDSRSIILKSITIYMFYNLLTSFGMDTFFNELFFMMITLYIFNRYVFVK